MYSVQAKKTRFSILSMLAAFFSSFVLLSISFSLSFASLSVWVSISSFPSLSLSLTHFFFNYLHILFLIVRLRSYVQHLPAPGETTRARRHQTAFGGKGANQCVSAAKLGSKTVLISKVMLNST